MALPLVKENLQVFIDVKVNCPYCLFLHPFGERIYVHSLNLSWGKKCFFCKTRQQDFFKSWLLKSLDGESWSQRRCALTAAEETGPGTASRSFTPPVSSWAKYLDSRWSETFWKMNISEKKGPRNSLLCLTIFKPIYDLDWPRWYAYEHQARKQVCCRGSGRPKKVG